MLIYARTYPVSKKSNAAQMLRMMSTATVLVIAYLVATFVLIYTENDKIGE
jgi:hypothetical protein